MGVREDEATLREAARRGKLKYKVVDTGSDRASRPAGSVNRYHIVDSEGRFAGSASNQTYAKELSAMLQSGRDRPAHLSPGGNQVALVDHYESVRGGSAKPAAASAASTRPETLGKLEVVKQSNGKFVIVDQASGGVLHSKAGKTSSGRALPAAPMEFGSKELAAGTIKDMRDRYAKNSRYNPSFVKTEVAVAANAAGELPVTFDPKDTQAKGVKFLADEAYDKGYRVIDRGPDVPGEQRYTFKNPDGAASNQTFATQRLAQDAMVKNRGTSPQYGKAPKFEGVDYTPPKPEQVATPEPAKVEPEPVKPTSTAKPPPEVAPVVDGPTSGVGAEAVVNGREVELRVDGKVVSKNTFNGTDKYYVTDGKRWIPADNLEAARNMTAGSEKFKVIDIHQTNQAGTWSRLGTEAAEPALGHPLYEKGKPAPVVEPAPKPTPVTPASVVEDAVNKGKAARGEATIPVTEGTAMPKNPKPVGQGLEVIDRGAKGWQPGRRFVVRDKAGNVLFEGKKADAAAALERMKKVPTSVLESTQGLNTSMRGLRDIPVQTGTVVGSAETTARQQLIAQAAQAAQAEAQAAGRIPFQMTPNVPPMTGPAPAPVMPAAGASPVSYPNPVFKATSPERVRQIRLQGIRNMTPVMRAPQPAPLVPQQMVPFQTTPFSGAPSAPVSAASAAADAAVAGATKGAAPSAVGTGFVRPAGGTGFVRAAAPFDAAEAWKAAHTVPETVGPNLRFATKAGSNELSKLGKAQKFFAGAPVTGAIPRMTAGLPSALKYAPKTGLGGLGIGLLGNVVGNVAGDALDKSNLLGGRESRANDAVSAAIRGAGLGAGIGMAIPGVGVPLGALGGAAIGGLWNYLSNNGGGQQQSEMGTLEELTRLQTKYGLDDGTMAQIADDYNLRMDMAETDADRTAARTAARTAFQNAVSEGNQRFSVGGMDDALAMQAMIGNYIQPYATMYAGLENKVADAYDRAARSMSGDFAQMAKIGAARSRADAMNVAGSIMGAAMVDPMVATQQKQAGQLAQIEQQLFAQQMTGMLGGGTSGSNLLGEG